MQAPGKMRVITPAVLRLEKDGEHIRQAQCLRRGGGKPGAGDSPAKLKDEELIEYPIAQCHYRRRRECHAWPADAVEEAKHRPGGGSKKRTCDARQPKLGGEPL